MLWLNDLPDDAMEQVHHLANLPFTFHHVAIMPDAHIGYGMPIGGVFAADRMIVPNAVGVDIGCGMCAVRTSLGSVDKPKLRRVISAIRECIPLGFKHHRRPMPHDLMPVPDTDSSVRTDLPIVEQEYENARFQIGTLGGGNHFIEIQQGKDGAIWFMIHSGSRNLGYQVAGHYNKRAISLNKRWRSPVPPAWQLAHLPLDNEEGQLYLREMQYCVAFARSNRKVMENMVKQVLLKEISADIVFAEPINIAHNYAAIEDHFGTSVVVHRKGATRARKNEIGIIPGSQGSSSYIVKGCGNPNSFQSCSHGAGRKMGRKEAQRNLDLEQEKQRLDAMGILHGLRGRRDLEEAAGAYKNITEVIARQTDLINIVEVLQPLAVIKG